MKTSWQSGITAIFLSSLDMHLLTMNHGNSFFAFTDLSNIERDAPIA